MPAAVAFTEEANGHIVRLLDHYEAKGYDAAAANLAASLAGAIRRMETVPAPAYSAPRPYPELARYGWNWIIEGGYWFGFIPGSTFLVTAVFHNTANIPGLLRQDYGTPD